ncbi:MAG TPA: SpoIID/LytB domain-containing protein, partial [Gemmatimonadaceae bacterium]|nr:SpoIID/LytB domain-containing protein [Gemmatimonadaceae bacterium]
MGGRLFPGIVLIACLGACSASIPPMKPRLSATPVASAPSVTPAVPTTAAVPASSPPPPPVPTTTITPPAAVPRVVEGHAGREQNDIAVRVAIATEQHTAQLSASGAWTLYDRTGEHPLMGLNAGDRWTVEACDGMLCAKSVNGDRTPSIAGPLVARPADENSVLVYNGKRYRGELLIVNAAAGLIVVNRLSIESYLRGVVPMEIGTDRTMSEEAAVEAQAIAARSYVYKRLDDSRPYDVTCTVLDQVYGGMDAERAVSDSAIDATEDMVLMYNGKVADAPYHSNSGGVTAAASEVWNADDKPYLTSVSDRIPGSDHYYDEQSPRFRWTRTYDLATLESVVDKYLPKYATVPDD